MTERGFYPKAIVKNIPPGPNDPPIVPRIAVLHVAVSNADSLYNYFNGPSGGVESHFYIRFDGAVEQYRSIFWQADAQLDANDWCVSIETAGMGHGEWTTAQLAAIKALLSWLHDAAGIKLEECTAWNGEGVGYHTMWGAPSHWTPSVKTCPGPKRIQQFQNVLVPWMAVRRRTVLPVRHRIVSTNLFVKNPAPKSLVSGPLAGLNMIVARVKAAFRFPPDVIACQEAHPHLAELRRLEGYRTLVDTGHGQAGRELGQLLRDGRKLLGTEFHRAADGVPELGGAFDHPRGVFVVKCTKRRRKVAVVNTHMGLIRDETALAEGKTPGEAARQHAEHAQLVLRIARRLERNGYTVFVCADANSKGTWSKSLPAVLAAAGMKVTLNRVDLVACWPKQVRAPKVAIVDRHEVGSDTHDAVAISATERRRA